MSKFPSEGASNHYRELYRHGGIRCGFRDPVAAQAAADAVRLRRAGTDQPEHRPAGRRPTLDEDALAVSRVDKVAWAKEHVLDDGSYDDVTIDWSRITVPFLLAANWGGAGLHLRGNIEAFTNSVSEHKYLEVHGLEHWTHFYTPYGVDLQRRFLDRYLKGEDNAWENEPRVRLQVRHVDGFVERHEAEWLSPVPSGPASTSTPPGCPGRPLRRPVTRASRKTELATA